jgi:hypothetical protein
VTTEVGGNPLAEFLERLDALQPQLARAAARPAGDGLTEPDPATGEQWVGGQVWAHMAEFVPYWIAEIRKVVDPDAPEPVPFGRVKSDPGRIAAIEARRGEPVEVLFDSTAADVETLRHFLEELDGVPGAWQRLGEHSKLGVMGVVRMVDEFLVGHLEEHLRQLDELAGAGD